MLLKATLAILITTVALGGLIQGRTSAMFTNSHATSDNTFTSGTFDIRLGDGNETNLDDVSATWMLVDAKPGDTVSATLQLKNVGTALGNHVEISTTNSITEDTSIPGNTASIPLDRVMEIISFVYDGVDKRDLISDSNGNGIKDLEDLESTLIDNLVLADINITHTLQMTVLFNYDLSGNQHHGDSMTMTMTVAFNQMSSQ